MAEPRLFQALADPTRLRIVGILAEGPLNVTRIVNRVKAAQPAVSRHLRILREVGVIKDRRLGKEVEYSLEVARVREAGGWLVSLAGEGGLSESQGRSRRLDEAEASGGQEAAPGVPAPLKKKPARISPLEARGGKGVAQAGRETAAREQEAEAGRGGALEVAGAGHVAEQRVSSPRRRTGRRGAGIGRKSSRGRRLKAGARRKPPPAPTRKPSAEKPEEAEPGYVVKRDDDKMDDFLL